MKGEASGNSGGYIGKRSTKLFTLEYGLKKP